MSDRVGGGGGFIGGLLIGWALKKGIEILAVVVGLFSAILANGFNKPE
jgi:uncharacterized membrane protein (Fun14 family)